jgi:hypothetical protein
MQPTHDDLLDEATALLVHALLERDEELAEQTLGFARCVKPCCSTSLSASCSHCSTRMWPPSFCRAGPMT